MHEFLRALVATVMVHLPCGCIPVQSSGVAFRNKSQGLCLARTLLQLMCMINAVAALQLAEARNEGENLYLMLLTSLVQDYSVV